MNLFVVGQACGGAVLKCLSEKVSQLQNAECREECLSEKVSQLQNAECREEVLYFERRLQNAGCGGGGVFIERWYELSVGVFPESFTFTPCLDMPLQQSCKDDAGIYCGSYEVTFESTQKSPVRTMQACAVAWLLCLPPLLLSSLIPSLPHIASLCNRRTVEDPALDVPLQQACKGDTDMYCGPWRIQPWTCLCSRRARTTRTCTVALMPATPASLLPDPFPLCNRRTVEDPALDVPLQQACKDDADMYCGAGAGYAGRDHSRTLSCLRQNRKKLSAKCKAEELRFTAMEVGAVRCCACEMECGGGVCGEGQQSHSRLY
ncbi:unnamed protein product [Closterium sp. NIES-54]